MENAGPGRDPIATFTHDAGGTPRLFAYLPEPSLVTRQGELLANRVYGSIETRSPTTPYVCLWRDPDPARFRAKEDAGPPHKILMSCSFGIDAWSPPANLAEQAYQAMQRDEARVTMGWGRRDGTYLLTRLEVTVSNLAERRDFRSVWFDDEVTQLAIDNCVIDFPISPVDPISFSVSASLPRRYNQHEAPKEPSIAFSMIGTAPPIPEWVLY